MKKLFKIIFKIFDKLEDIIRGKLTHYPIIYSIIGSVAIVSIWRGIWVISDDLKLTGWESLIGGTLLALVTGLMVSFFIGENIIISGLNRGKKIEEKTEAEVRYEENILFEIQKDIKDLKESLKEKI